ncbi:reverse transcriptase domain-containing protein [Tanacetum coccineum]
MDDDQPTWGNNRAVAPTLGAAIVAVDLRDNFTVKGHHLSMIKDRQFDGRSLADRHKHIAKFIKLSWTWFRTRLGPFLHHPLCGWSTGFITTPLNTGRLPSQRLDPALPKLFWFTPTFPTCLTVAEQFLDIKRTSPEGNFNVADFPSFAISFATAPAALANCPPFPSVISMLCMAVPKGISVEVDSSFLSIKTPSQTVQASSKAYGFLDVDGDIYTDGSYIYGIMKYHMGGYIGIKICRITHEDEAEEVKKEAEPLPKKPTQTDTPPLKSYKPKISYPQRLNKEKIDARYAKFLDMIKEVRINVPLVDVLAGMPNYGKFLKDLVSNKIKMEQISAAFLTEECSAILQNKIPPKLGDPKSFLIPCKLANSVEYLALADLGASINLMPYSLYAALSGTTLKPTRMSIRLANHTYQYPMGVAENMLVQVRKFMFPVDFVILQMEEDDRVPLILGRPFLHTTDAIIRAKNNKLNLGIGEDRATFHIDKAMQHSHMNDDTCFRMDVINEITKDELDALLDDSKPFLNTSKKISKTSLDKEFDELMSGNVQEDEVKDNFEELPPKDELRIRTSIQDPPTDLELKHLPKHLEYAILEENSLLPVVISALLKQNEKKRLVSVLKNHKEEFAWKTSDIPGISPSFCKHKINFEDDVKPIIQRQRRLNPNMKEVVKKDYETSRCRGSFIVNEHRVKLYHDEEQLNKLTIEEIHLMSKDGRMKAIPLMAPFPANYRETMPWASEKPYIYSVVENTCNEAKLYDLDKTGKEIVIENVLYVPSKGSSLEKK